MDHDGRIATEGEDGARPAGRRAAGGDQRREDGQSEDAEAAHAPHDRTPDHLLPCDPLAKPALDQRGLLQWRRAGRLEIGEEDCAVKRLFVLAGAIVGIGALVVVVVGAASAGSSRKVPALASVGTAHGYILKGAATGQLKRPTIPITVTRNGVARSIDRPVPTLSGAAVVSEQQAICPQGVVPNCDERVAGADAGSSGNLGLDSGTSPGTLGCSNRNPDGGRRVNQDCTFRRQAEEDITYSSADPSNLVAGQNDSRVGFNQCGIDFSTNNGRLWGDMLPPFRQSLNDPPDAVPNTIGGDPGTFHTYDAASDPVNATDSRGRAFFSCVVFDVASNASGVFVTESPVGAQGSFYFNVPQIGRTFMPVQDNSPLIAHDKNWIAADHYVHSPNRDNVYVTWTVFKFGPSCLGGTDTAPAFCESPIYGSMSTDHGQTWSAPEQISGTSSLCSFGNFFNPSLPANDCNFDQGSNPVVLPNGDLEVVYNNGNTPAGNPNGQQLGVHCHPTGKLGGRGGEPGAPELRRAGQGRRRRDFRRAAVRLRARPGGVHPGDLHPHERLPADRDREHPEQPPLRGLAGLPQWRVRRPHGQVDQRRPELVGCRTGQPGFWARPLLRGGRPEPARG